MTWRADWTTAREIAICQSIITPNITEEISWQTKKEVVIEGANEQPAQIKSPTSQNLNELDVSLTENGASRSDNYPDDRSLLGAILDDRSPW